MPALKNIFTLDVIRDDHDDAFDRLRNVIANRFDQLEILIKRHLGLCRGTMFTLLVKYFIHGNLPISQIEAPFFRNFLSCVNPGITSDLPTSHQLRSTIIQRAVALRNCICAATSGNRSMSLMADAVPKAGRAWLGICLTTANQLPFRRLVHEVDEKTSTIANTMADTVHDLRMR
jgi:hypothetical protein